MLKGPTTDQINAALRKLGENDDTAVLLRAIQERDRLISDYREAFKGVADLVTTTTSGRCRLTFGPESEGWYAG